MYLYTCHLKISCRDWVPAPVLFISVCIYMPGNDLRIPCQWHFVSLLLRLLVFFAFSPNLHWSPTSSPASMGRNGTVLLIHAAWEAIWRLARGGERRAGDGGENEGEKWRGYREKRHKRVNVRWESGDKVGKEWGSMGVRGDSREDKKAGWEMRREMGRVKIDSCSEERTARAAVMESEKSESREECAGTEGIWRWSLSWRL